MQRYANVGICHSLILILVHLLQKLRKTRRREECHGTPTYISNHDDMQVDERVVEKFAEVLAVRNKEYNSLVQSARVAAGKAHAESSRLMGEQKGLRSQIRQLQVRPKMSLDLDDFSHFFQPKGTVHKHALAVQYAILDCFGHRIRADSHGRSQNPMLGHPVPHFPFFPANCTWRYLSPHCRRLKRKVKGLPAPAWQHMP